jgi:hypothetical protein
MTTQQSGDMFKYSWKARRGHSSHEPHSDLGCPTITAGSKQSRQSNETQPPQLNTKWEKKKKSLFLCWEGLFITIVWRLNSPLDSADHHSAEKQGVFILPSKNISQDTGLEGLSRVGSVREVGTWQRRVACH